MRAATLLLLLGVAGAQNQPVAEQCGHCGGPWTPGYGCTRCYPRNRGGDTGGDGRTVVYIPPHDQHVADAWNELAGQLAALTGTAFRVDPLRLRATVEPLDRAIEWEFFWARSQFDGARDLLKALAGEHRTLEAALRRTRTALAREERNIAVYELRQRKLDALCETLDEYRVGARARACSRLEALRRLGKIASPLAYLPPPPALAPRYAQPARAEPVSREVSRLRPLHSPPPKLYKRPPDVLSDPRRALRVQELARAKSWKEQARALRAQIAAKGLTGAAQIAATALDKAARELARRIRESERLRRFGDALMAQAHAKMADATGWGLVDTILPGRGDAFGRTQKVLELTLDRNGDDRDIIRRAVDVIGLGTVAEIRKLRDELWDGLFAYAAAVNMTVLGPNAPADEAEYEKLGREHAQSSVQDILTAGWKAMGGP